MSQADPEEVVCRDGCKRVAGSAGGWTYLQLQKRWRCPQCARELAEVNLQYSMEYYVNEEKRLDAEILGHMQRLDIKPGDTMVVTYPHVITNESLDILEKYVQSKFPGYTVIVLSGGPQIGVVGRGDNG